MQQTRDQLLQMTAERDRLAAQAVQAENQLKVERATQLQIAAQMRSLEEDNARLKGDLAFFESLLPAQGAQRGVVIRSFKLQPDTDDGHMRYRLLVQQSGPPGSGLRRVGRPACHPTERRVLVDDPVA